MPKVITGETHSDRKKIQQGDACQMASKYSHKKRQYCRTGRQPWQKPFDKTAPQTQQPWPLRQTHKPLSSAGRRPISGILVQDGLEISLDSAAGRAWILKNQISHRRYLERNQPSLLLSYRRRRILTDLRFLKGGFLLTPQGPNGSFRRTLQWTQRIFLYFRLTIEITYHKALENVRRILRRRFL